MTLLFIFSCLLIVFFVLRYFQNKLDSISFFRNRKSKALRARILLLLRGNEEALQRMYKRESALYPDLQEWEILERILVKIESDR